VSGRQPRPRQPRLSTAEAAPALIYATDTRERSGERRRRLGD